jgi:hypothetical protein
LLEEAGASLVAMDGKPILASQFLAAGSPSVLPRLVDVLRASAIEL